MYEIRRPVLIVSDPDIIKNVLIKNFNSFCNRRVMPLLPAPMKRGLNLLQNDEWKEVRNILTPTFSAAKMKQMSFVMNECCDRLVSYLDKAREGGIPVECRHVFGGYTMDVIARCGFGLRADSYDKDDPFVRNGSKMFDFKVESLVSLLLVIFPVLATPLTKLTKYSLIDQSAVDFFVDVTKEVVNLRRRGERESKNIDVLQLLLNAHNDPEYDQGESASRLNGRENVVVRRKPLSTTDVLAQALTFFSAGYETTNTVLSLTAYLLAMNQDVQEKLYAEIDSLTPTRNDVTYGVIHNMVYLDMVISESLRLFPPVVLLERVCNETTRYNGLTIEKGLVLFISTWSIHHSEDYWPNPTQFDPERFNADNKANIKPYTYMPFGLGPRNCIAMRFALLEAKIALVRVLQQFRFDVCQKTQIPPTLKKFGLISPESVMLSVIPRN
ncbi:cytochrome P450 3A9-like isoform X2 [Acanthaster planci]|nr:cytochrome P450 3A9-like isoform X2 [Acanthaster planci]